MKSRLAGKPQSPRRKSIYARAPPGRPAGARSQLAGHSRRAAGGQLGRRSTRPPARFLSGQRGHFRLATWAAANRAKVGPFRRASGRPACLGADSGLAGRRLAGRGLSAADRSKSVARDYEISANGGPQLALQQPLVSLRVGPLGAPAVCFSSARRSLAARLPLACRSLATRQQSTVHNRAVHSQAAAQKWLGTSYGQARASGKGFRLAARSPVQLAACLRDRQVHTQGLWTLPSGRFAASDAHSPASAVHASVRRPIIRSGSFRRATSASWPSSWPC